MKEDFYHSDGPHAGLYHRAAKLRKLQACTDQPREASPADEKALKDDVAALLQTCSERLADTEAKRHAAYDAIEQQHLNALKDTVRILVSPVPS